VLVTQRALVNLMLAAGERPGLRAGDALALVGPAAGTSPAELLAPLAAGATLVVPPAGRAGASALDAALDADGATIVAASPDAWRLAGARERPRRVRALCIGPIGTPLAEELSRRHAEAWSLYGHAETGVWASGHRLARGRPPSLGRPLANTVLRLLDADRQMVPVGVVGEIHVAGAGLARGYAAAAGLTAERFVPDPFAAEPGERMFRTGQWGRYRPDGRLELVGRWASEEEP
jgi:non-ribosomal peptide synthetase component F